MLDKDFTRLHAISHAIQHWKSSFCALKLTWQKMPMREKIASKIHNFYRVFTQFQKQNSHSFRTMSGNIFQPPKDATTTFLGTD